MQKGVYSTFLKQNEKTSGDVTNEEEAALLMYFFRKFFFGTTFVGIVQELQPYVSKMMSGQAYSWGPFFLGGLYRGIFILLEQLQRNNQINKIQGPIGFLQLWAQLYFKDFLPPRSSVTPLPATRTLGPQLATAAIRSLSKLEVVRAVFHWTMSAEDWRHVLERGIGPKWIIDTLLPDANLSPHERKTVMDN